VFGGRGWGRASWEGKSIPNKSQTDISAFIVLGLDNICHFLSIPGQPINPFHLNHPSYITLMPREVPLQGYLNTMGFPVLSLDATFLVPET